MNLTTVCGPGAKRKAAKAPKIDTIMAMFLNTN